MAIILGTDLGYIAPGSNPLPSPFRDTRTLSIEGAGDWRVDESDNFIIQKGVTGLNFPPVDIQTQQIPGGYGGTVLQRTVTEREIFLPVRVTSFSSHGDYLARIGELFRNLSPLQYGTRDGNLKLVASSSSGTREIGIVYKGGMEGNEVSDGAGGRWTSMGLTFVAVDPYWKSRATESASFSLKGLTNFLSKTEPWPRQLSTSKVIGANMPVQVGGQVPVWPRITVQGPAAGVHITTGQGMDVQLNGPFLAGDTLVLETDPAVGRSLLKNGVPSWKTVQRGAVFKQMIPGSTTISMDMSDTTTDTSVLIEWTPGYYAAWG